MIDREWKLRALRRVLGHEKIVKGDEYVFVCPNPECQAGKPVKKPKLSVNLKTDRCHCWVCELGGPNLARVLKHHGVTDDYRTYVSAHRSHSRTTTPARQYDTPSLPVEYRSLSRVHRTPYYDAAIGYLRSRGVGREEILRYRLGYCEDGQYRNRIIVPSYDRDGLNFCVGRAIYDGMLNYKHEDLCKDVVWNDYLLDWSRPVTVVEGPFDAFKAWDNVTALQGSILREGSRLFSRIVDSGNDVYFAMDPDAFEKQLDIVTVLLEYGIQSLLVPLGTFKDPGDMHRLQFQHIKTLARPVRSRVDLLRTRLNACC